MNFSKNNLTDFDEIVFTSRLIFNLNVLEIFDSISLLDLNNLKKLDLSHNLITHVPYAINALSSLEILKFDNNFLTSIKNYSLYKLKSLQQLMLNNNKIRSIDSDALATFINLKFIDISNNFLPGPTKLCSSRFKF